MTDIPPELMAAMAAQAPVNGGPRPGEDPASESVEALMRAIAAAANKSAMDDNAAESKDYAQAALYAAQALVILDPERDGSGTPLEHQVTLERVRGENALKQTQERSAAPTPARRINVKRDSSGRATSYEREG